MISGDMATGSSLGTPLEFLTAVTGDKHAIFTMSTNAPSAGPVIFVNGREWIWEEVTMQMNRLDCIRPWNVIGPVDEIASESHSPSHKTPYDCFMWTFPQGHLSEMVYSTNHKLQQLNLRITSNAEFLGFFGDLLLITRCEFGNRRSRWSSYAFRKCLPPPSFGVVMSRKIFEEIRLNVSFTGYAADVSNMDDRWGLVKRFVDAINVHHATFVKQPERICVDERIFKWYELGGS